MTIESETTEAKSLSELFGMEFNEDGSLSSATKVGNTPIFQKMNRKQRRTRGIYSHKFQKVLKRI